MLELRNVSAGYGNGKVLENVSLVVPDGAVVALLGPNGAGKTTLLKVMSGLLRPSAGQILLDGTDVHCGIPLRAGASRDLSRPGGPRHLSDPQRGRQPAPPGAEVGDRRAVALAASVFPRLEQRRNQLAGTMSGGEQQMLALSRAYVAEPSTVLLDEVSMGLAPKIVDEIFDYLRRLAAEGISLLVVEQYVARALELADYVYILNRGRIRFAGESAEVGDETVLESYLGALTS